MSGVGPRSRLQECTASQSEPVDRTPEQQQRLDDILAASGVSE